jgi:cysteine desulfurase/selenocysteine lyase
MLDVQKIRKDFPILKSNIIYLDSAASSLTPEPVIDKMMEFYRDYRANVERGVHRLSVRATEELSKARKKVCQLINAKSESGVIFTKNTTEGINTVANGISWKKSDKIVTTLVEHHSNFIVWQRITKKTGATLEIVSPDKEGLFNIRDFEKAIDKKTRLVALAHVSNVLGSTLPVKEVAKLAHENGAEVLVDGAQSVPHMPVDVRGLGMDYLAFSGHKMLGPTGVGVLFINEEVLEKLESPFVGGGTIEEVGLEDYKLGPSPERFEAGTPPIAEAIGLGGAVDYLQKIGLGAVAKHDHALGKRMYQGLSEIPKVEVFGPSDAAKRSGITSFNVEDMSPHDVAAVLDNSAKVMVRSGHHCAMPLHKKLLNRPDGTVRASAYIYNTEEEIEKFISTVEEISRTLT